MNTGQRFKIVIVNEMGVKRKVSSQTSFNNAVKFKKSWKKGNPGDQVLIQPEYGWEKS
tara:strand:+ start:1543 stop:1716 length:174 start_codon:yes stop_codon:yes gene_type:complete